MSDQLMIQAAHDIGHTIGLLTMALFAAPPTHDPAGQQKTLKAIELAARPFLTADASPYARECAGEFLSSVRAMLSPFRR